MLISYEITYLMSIKSLTFFYLFYQSLYLSTLEDEKKKNPRALAPPLGREKNTRGLLYKQSTD